jgi:hypothetical protein
MKIHEISATPHKNRLRTKTASVSDVVLLPVRAKLPVAVLKDKMRVRVRSCVQALKVVNCHL